MTYFEKLKDPQWQKVRLRILERDGFSCVCCETETKTLHVHHCYYVSRRDPWEYFDSALITLCEDCHKLADEMASPSWMICSVFEWTSHYELQRQIENRINSVKRDDGCLTSFCSAANHSGWPIIEAMNVLTDASNLGIITNDWLSNLSKQVAAIQNQKQ